MNRRHLITLAGAVAAGWHGRSVGEGSWLSPGPRIPDVTLRDHEGRGQSLVDLCKQPVVISFFFTGCTSICPPQTAAMRDLRQQLSALSRRGDERGPLLLSISLDPLADTPAALREYARRFDVHLGREEGWLMLTGDTRMLEPVWRAFDAPVGQPAEHTSVLWIGSASARRWTRASALTPTRLLVDLFVRGLT